VSKIEKKVYFHKSGTGHYTPKVSLPKEWTDELGLTQEDNIVIIEYKKDQKEITIKKK